jgi:hypothetical protein
LEVRRSRWVLAVFALVSALSIVAAAGASAVVAPDAEDGFVGRIAAERAGAGLAAYGGADDLVAVARRHAARMAAEHRLYHNPSLGSDVTGWSAVGENVGVGASVDDIHRAFMASATHRHAILSEEFTEVGIGVEVDADGALWVVEVFRRPETAGPAPTAGGDAASSGGGGGETGTVRAASAAAPRAARPVAAPAGGPVAGTPAPVAAAAPTTSVVAPVVAPAADPAEPVVVAAVAGAFDRTAVGGLLTSAGSPPSAVRGPAASPASAARSVTAPVGIAASLLLLVVLGLLVEVAAPGRYPAARSVSVWRRQRSHASISSSRSPSRTAWTFPVS